MVFFHVLQVKRMSKDDQEKGHIREMSKERKKVQEFKLFLFGKDVLSIIDSYYLKEFDEWFQNIKNVHKEYNKFFYSTNYGIMSCVTGGLLFNFRKSSYNESCLWKIYNYNFKNENYKSIDTNIILNPKKYF